MEVCEELMAGQRSGAGRKRVRQPLSAAPEAQNGVARGFVPDAEDACVVSDAKKRRLRVAGSGTKVARDQDYGELRVKKPTEGTAAGEADSPKGVALRGLYQIKDRGSKAEEEQGEERMDVVHRALAAEGCAAQGMDSALLGVRVKLHNLCREEASALSPKSLKLHVEDIAARIGAYLKPRTAASISPLEQVSRSDLEAHIVSLRREGMQKSLKCLLGRLMVHNANKGTFNSPVDPVALNLPDYFRVIPKPLDLGTIKQRLNALLYREVDTFAEDVRLVFRNAMRYNPAKNVVHEAAKTLLHEFEHDFSKMMSKMDKEDGRRAKHECPHCQGQTCVVCGEKCLKFEPAVLICQGACGQRIKKGQIYYIAPDGARLWCRRCYGSLPTVIPKPTFQTPHLIQPENACIASPTPSEAGSYYHDHDNDNDNDNDAASDTSEEDGSDKDQDTAARAYEPAERTNPVARGKLPPEEGGLQLKRGLLKRRFDEEVSEPWVQCDGCEKWVHQICALFNPRATILEDPDTCFLCPLCKLRKDNNGGVLPPARVGGRPRVGQPVAEPMKIRIKLRKATEVVSKPPSDVDMSPSHVSETSSECSSDAENKPETPKGFGVGKEWCAEALPRCVMSEIIEGSVRQRLAELGFADVAPTINIRVVSQAQAKLPVPEVVRNSFRLARGGAVPADIPFVSKNLLAFQRINGVDVCQFSLYVQEYGVADGAAGAAGAAAAHPSERRVYIAYLDSVEYFRPRAARTEVYHEILSAYLFWARLRGFQRAHIWACPPQRGNNFIFWCHPAHQRTPTKERLTEWYRKLFRRGESLGVVSAVHQLYDRHFAGLAVPENEESAVKEAGGVRASKGGKGKGKGKQSRRTTFQRVSKADAASIPLPSKQTYWANQPGAGEMPPCPPIFDGDYWLEEVCRLNTQLQRRKKAAKKHSPLAMLRNILTGMMKRQGAIAYFNRPVDPVALNLPTYLDIIRRPMDLGTVLTALDNCQFTCVLGVVQDVRLVFQNAMRFNPPHNPVHEIAKTMAEAFEKDLKIMVGKLEPHMDPAEAEDLLGALLLDTSGSKDKAEERNASDHSRGKSLSFVGPKSWLWNQLAKSTFRLRNDMFELDLQAQDVPSVEAEEDREEEHRGEERTRGSLLARRMRGVDQRYCDLAQAVIERFDALDHIGDTSDPDLLLGLGFGSTPLLNARQTFLEVCQFQHYQFDTLRRAKYSSAMLLYHLHNREECDLTPVCRQCGERVVGVRWHCSSCSDVDFCTKCYTTGEAEKAPVHDHQLTPYRITYSEDERRP